MNEENCERICQTGVNFRFRVQQNKPFTDCTACQKMTYFIRKNFFMKFHVFPDEFH